MNADCNAHDVPDACHVLGAGDFDANGAFDPERFALQLVPAQRDLEVIVVEPAPAASTNGL